MVAIRYAAFAITIRNSPSSLTAHGFFSLINRSENPMSRHASASASFNRNDSNASVYGTLTSANQMGRPGNNALRQGADTNATSPAQQRELFFSQYVAMFKTFGYTEAEATALTLEWLPDILPYNYISAIL